MHLLIGPAAGEPPDFVVDGKTMLDTLPMTALQRACSSKRELWALGCRAWGEGFDSIDELVGALDEWLKRVQARQEFDALQAVLDQHRRRLAQARALERAALVAQDEVRPWDLGAREAAVVGERGRARRLRGRRRDRAAVVAVDDRVVEGAAGGGSVC
ncbi:MAG: hypothetical protein R3F65_09450 [bacterium]